MRSSMSWLLILSLELPSTSAACSWTEHSKTSTSYSNTKFPDGTAWKDSPDGTLEASLAIAKEGCLALRAISEENCKSVICITERDSDAFARCYLRANDALSPNNWLSAWIPDHSSNDCIGTTTTTTPLAGEYYKIVESGTCGDLSQWGYSSLSSYQCEKARLWFNNQNPVYEITQFACQSMGGCKWETLPSGCYFDTYRIVSTKYLGGKPGGYFGSATNANGRICSLITCANYTCPITMERKQGADLIIHPSQDKCCKPTSSDCSVLPQSMNGPSQPAGCSGAVWANGAPSKTYCQGRQGEYEAYPWWSSCCQWDGSQCMEREGTATLQTTTTQPQVCTSLPPSMNGASYPSGCSGAVWSNGVPSQTYCQGAQGRYPWWSACCYWDGSSCTEKEGTAVSETTTPAAQLHDCTALPASMNGDSFSSGCSGAVWTSGIPSKTYCTGKQGMYPWWAACCQWDESSTSCVAKQAASGGRRLILV